MEERTSFEDLWKSFKASNYSGSFVYAHPNVSFRKSVQAHFVPGHPPVRYGVYVVRVVSSGTVIYIGKGGTITSQGEFKDQDIPGRLTAKRGKLSSDAWFSLACSTEGPLSIEYAFLPTTRLAPATAEALLIQAFLSEHRRLPKLNKAF